METALDVQWTTKATRDLRRLDSRPREQVIAKVEQYAANPDALRNQVTRLVGQDYYRLRVGNYRVLFALEHGEVTVMVVERVRHRREAYD